jgi:hypothetical protein
LIAIYVETTDYGDVFLTSLINYESKYRSITDLKTQTWKMGRNYLNKYASDKQVFHIRINFDVKNWNWK